MRPGILNLPTIWRGCDWLQIVMIWKDQDGNPINLSGFTPFAQTSNGIDLNPEVLSAIDGVTTLSLTKEETATFPLGTPRWDWIWWKTSESGHKYPPFLSGTVPIKEPVTSSFS